MENNINSSEVKRKTCLKRKDFIKCVFSFSEHGFEYFDEEYCTYSIKLYKACKKCMQNSINSLLKF